MGGEREIEETEREKYLKRERERHTVRERERYRKNIEREREA